MKSINNIKTEKQKAPKVLKAPIVLKERKAPIIPKERKAPIVLKERKAPIVPKAPIVLKERKAPIVLKERKAPIVPIVPKEQKAPIVLKERKAPIVPEKQKAPIERHHKSVAVQSYISNRYKRKGPIERQTNIYTTPIENECKVKDGTDYGIIGNGEFSQVCRMKNNKIVKIINGTNKENLYEIKLLKYIKKYINKSYLDNILNYIFDFTLNNKTYIITDDTLGYYNINCYDSSKTDEYCEKIISKRIDIISQLLITIKELHNIGIIHYDLKPDNILYSLDKNKIKIIDFGISEYTTLETDNKNSYTRGTGLFIDLRFYNTIPNLNEKKLIDLWAIGNIILEFYDILSFNYLLREKSELCIKIKSNHNIRQCIYQMSTKYKDLEFIINKRFNIIEEFNNICNFINTDNLFMNTTVYNYILESGIRIPKIKNLDQNNLMYLFINWKSII